MSLLSCLSFDLYCILSYYYFAMIELIKMDGWKLIMSRHLLTRNISSKSMHAFLSNLANRQTDRQTDKHGQKHVPPPLSKVIIEVHC